MDAIVLHRIDHSRNMSRFYRLDVQPDLFGSWLFVWEWGRIGSRGQVRRIPFTTLYEARIALECRRHAKEKRGYVSMKTS